MKKIEGQNGVKRANDDVMEESATKRARFQSTREFFDPDDDFYENFSTEADAMEIYWRMQYPPVPIIPTGPRAQQQQLYGTPSYPYYYGPRRSPEKRTYYNKHLDLTSSYNTAATNSPIDPKTSVSHHHHHHYYNSYNHNHHHNHHNHHNQYHHSHQLHNTTTEQQSYDTRMPTPTTTATSTSISAYDSSVSTTPTTSMNIPTGPAADLQPTEPKLPANWRWATDNNGNVYYYNRLTGKTQWEMPEDKASSIEGVSQAELDGFVEKAIQDAQQKKKGSSTTTSTSTPMTESRQPSSVPIVTPTVANSSTSTSASATPATEHRRPLMNGSGDVNLSSTGSSSSSKRKALKEAGLKQEVGKVVTKYLSSKKTLWRNDKTVFKELARKVLILLLIH